MGTKHGTQIWAEDVTWTLTSYGAVEIETSKSFSGSIVLTPDDVHKMADEVQGFKDRECLERAKLRTTKDD